MSDHLPPSLHPSDPTATHVLLREPGELPGIAVMHCGATVAIQDDGSTIPAGFDFYLVEQRAKATCLACPVLADLREPSLDRGDGQTESHERNGER